MFDVLKKLPVVTAIDALFYASRILRHAGKNPVTQDKSSPLWHLSDEPGAKSFSIAIDLVKEIEQKEGKPLAEFDASLVQSYSNVASNLLAEYAYRDYQPDLRRGRALLTELKANGI